MYRVGNLIGVLGIAVCVGSVVGRFLNEPYIWGFQAINLWNIGVGLLVMGCFAKISGR